MDKWYFPVSQDDSQTGISDSGIETFRGNIYSSLAREVCQNSMDAKMKDKEKTIVEFKLVNIDRNKLTDIETLIDAFEKSKEYGEKIGDSKTINFFEKSLKVLRKKKIPIMRISDFNTRGLLGSKERYGSDWINLIKGSGISQKGGTSGGSYGIGKSAPFAATDTRTIFYNTLDKKGVEAYQGVSKIISFINEDDNFTTGTGYYGNGSDPIYEQIEIDPNFKRIESGTDLYLLGFKKEENWKDEIIKSVVDGYLLAIYDNELSVKVEDVIINKKTLDELINKYKEDKGMEKAVNYYKVLTSEKTMKKSHILEDLGEIEVLVLVEQGLHRRALISRMNGMKIFDMSHISGVIPFAAIVKLKGEKVDVFFRLLEPPAHDKWVPDLYEKNKSLARRRVRDIRASIKKIVEELGKDTISDEMDPVGVGDYLPDMDEVFDSKSEEKEKKKRQSIVDIKEVIPKVKEEKSQVMEEIEGEFDEEGKNIGGNPTGDPNDTDGGRGITGTYIEGGQTPAIKIKHENIINKRMIYIGDNLYKVILKTDKPEKKGYLKFYIIGETLNENAKILEAISVNSIRYIVGKSRVNFNNDELANQIELIIELDYSGAYALEVELYVYTE